MVTVLDMYTIEEQRSFVSFYGLKNLLQRIFIKKYFLFTVGSVCRIKRFHFGGKSFADDKEVETEARRWLRQQSKDIYAAGFSVMVKRWHKYIHVDTGHV
jgi:hypothetical protein